MTKNCILYYTIIDYIYIYYNYYNVIIKQIIATFIKLSYYYASMLEQNPDALSQGHRCSQEWAQI